MAFAGAAAAVAGVGAAAGPAAAAVTLDEIWDKDIFQVVAVGDNTGGAGGSDGNILQLKDKTINVLKDGLFNKGGFKPATGSSFLKSGNDVAYGLDPGACGGTARWVAVGDNVTGGGLSSGNILYSDDGISFRNVVASSEGFSVQGNAVIYGPQTRIWVAGGQTDATPGNGNLLWSNDGTCWATSTGISLNGLQGCRGLGVGLVNIDGDGARNFRGGWGC